MNPFTASPLRTPSLHPVSFSASSSTYPQSRYPFCFSNQAPLVVSIPYCERWLAAQGRPSLPTSLRPIDPIPGIPIPRGTVSFQGPDPYNFSHPLLANGPVVGHQSQAQESLVPYHHAPALLCDDLRADVKEKQPPRPCNAFMLFRSDFLKRKIVSRDQEARQQKLSIIVAKCWHRLTSEEKKKWFLEAEREKKAHALRYADRPPARARVRTRHAPKVNRSPRELEHLGHLADMAYREIINDSPSQLARKKMATPSTSVTPSSASGHPAPPPEVNAATELLTVGGYQERDQTFHQAPSSSPTGGLDLLSFPQSSQLPQSASGLTGFQDVHMFPCTRMVGAYPAARPASPAAEMRPGASSHHSGTLAAAPLLTTFSSQWSPQSSAMVQEVPDPSYFAMSGGSTC